MLRRQSLLIRQCIALAAVMVAGPIGAAEAVPSDLLVWTRGSASTDSVHGNTRVIATDDFVQVDASGPQVLGLTAEGRVRAWDYQSMLVMPQADAPTDAGYVHVSAGRFHAYALRADGSIVGWGSDYGGAVSQVPANDPGNPFVEVAGGEAWGMARRQDGTVVAWGDDTFGQVSGAAALSGVASIDAGYGHGVALKDDGTVVAWGRDTAPYQSAVRFRSTQDNPPLSPDTAFGTAWAGIAAGGYHTYVLSDAGHVNGSGWNYWFQFAFRDPANPAGTIPFVTQGQPSALNQAIIGVAAGERQGVALVWDGQSTYDHQGQSVPLGSIESMGFNDFGAQTAPEGSDFWAIASGQQANAALRVNPPISVPEPAAAGVAALGLVLMSNRTNNRRRSAV